MEEVENSVAIHHVLHQREVERRPDRTRHLKDEKDRVISTMDSVCFRPDHPKTTQYFILEHHFSNPLVFTAAKTSLIILMKSFEQKHSWEIFEEKKCKSTLQTIPLQIFCKTIFNSRIIVKGIISAEGNSSRNINPLTLKISSKN